MATPPPEVKALIESLGLNPSDIARLTLLPDGFTAWLYVRNPDGSLQVEYGPRGHRARMRRVRKSWDS